MIERLYLLVVDDHTDDRTLVIGELRRAYPSLEVVEIIDQAGFATALAAGTCDLVITDYALHWTTGLGILRAVKQMDPTCPVIILTDIDSTEIVVAAMKAGADDYVLKSAQRTGHLPGAVYSAIEGARYRRALHAAATPHPGADKATTANQPGSPKNEFLAEIAHQLNNPLSVILGHASMLRKSLTNTPGADQAQKIVQAAEKCSQIMRDFVLSSRQESPEQSAVATQVVRGARILVVDDEPGIAEVLAEVFQLDGHVVEMVGNGEAALAKLAVERYDLVLSDVRMPDLDGPALYREVERRHPHLLRRFIFLTGDVMSPETCEFLTQTDVPCLSKPFTLAMVREVVQCVLSEVSHA